VRVAHFGNPCISNTAAQSACLSYIYRLSALYSNKSEELQIAQSFNDRLSDQHFIDSVATIRKYSPPFLIPSPIPTTGAAAKDFFAVFIASSMTSFLLSCWGAAMRVFESLCSANLFFCQPPASVDYAALYVIPWSVRSRADSSRPFT